jgi:hypothetical protein
MIPLNTMHRKRVREVIFCQGVGGGKGSQVDVAPPLNANTNDSSLQYNISHDDEETIVRSITRKQSLKQAIRKFVSRAPHRNFLLAKERHASNETFDNRENFLSVASFELDSTPACT